jgi:Flp pilus assembly protein TadB
MHGALSAGEWLIFWVIVAVGVACVVAAFALERVDGRGQRQERRLQRVMRRRLDERLSTYRPHEVAPSPEFAARLRERVSDECRRLP